MGEDKTGGHVAAMGQMQIVYRVFMGKTEGNHLEDLGEDGRISKFVLIAVELVGV